MGVTANDLLSCQSSKFLALLLVNVFVDKFACSCGF